MASLKILPETIPISRFHELLSRYSSLIKTASSEKAPKAGQLPLVDLDKYRYETAVDTFQSDKPRRQMTHADVKKLVEWKLRHGKFRPTLMKLVSSNDEETVKQILQEATAQYWSDNNSLKAIGTIAKLKGIGPATASLLLSVHDPDQAIFFSDEAFWWLCCGGQRSPIKYNLKEYEQLHGAAHSVAERLQVGATDIERVAYVIMRDEAHQAASPSHPQSTSSTEKAKITHKTTPKAPPKRKHDSVIEADDWPPRRSQRRKDR